MPYTEPKVTIDLAEYNELLAHKALTQSPNDIIELKLLRKLVIYSVTEGRGSIQFGYDALHSRDNAEIRVGGDPTLRNYKVLWAKLKS